LVKCNQLIAINSPALEPEEDIYEEKSKILPCCLKTLSVSNFQGIKHTTIENLPVDTQWVFLVGENGFGKSTLLQAILLGLHGSKDGNYELIQNPDINIQVAYKNEKENLVNDCWQNRHPLAYIAAYGPSRLNLLGGDVDISEEERRSSVTYALFNSNGNLLNINAEFGRWALEKDKRFELVKKAFCRLIPYLADVKYNEKSRQIEYIEKDIIEGVATYEPLPYQKLASGFRAIIGIAGDMIIRLSRTQSKVTDPAKLKGIVIIDELDLHWHPKLQKQIPQLFSMVFPKIQFIVSTHSPIPLLGAPHNSVILKVTRTKEEGIQVERVPVELKYLTPNLILTSGIFDMDDVLSVENDDITKTRTEDSFEEMKHNDEVEQYLAEFEASTRQFPDALFEPQAN
jgi:predicted ATPase